MAKLDELLLKFDYRCQYCERDVEFRTPQHPLHATLDHWVPATRGGGRGDNLVLACIACNAAKGDMTGEEFLAFRSSAKLSESYIKYLEEKLFRLMNRKPPKPIEVRARSPILRAD